MITYYQDRERTSITLEEKWIGVIWCSGRDLDPGLRLERPEYLTGLYYRSASARRCHAVCAFIRINLIPSKLF